jgi:glycosyltransferase involved in cell wall biosynthesis
MLKEYDHVVYNMGNYLSFHKDIYEVSRVIRGIVIVHDFVMHHFFTGYYFSHEKDANAYVRDMEMFYGDEGKRDAIGSLSAARRPVWESDEIAKYPFVERTIEGALGVIVHSHFHGSMVKRKYLGPVGVLYHPFDAKKSISVITGVQKASLGLQENKVLLITVGHVNPNKRIDTIIRVLGKNKQIAKKLTYIIIGPCEHEAYLSDLKILVNHYDLTDTVTFMGFHPDDVLYSYMSAADGFINLRFPAMEGASWSLVEELHFGKPVKVSDTGCYSEMPDECVLKIRTNREEEDILQALKRLAYKDRSLLDIGIRGKEFALTTFSASRYCDSFLRFLDEVRSWKPVLGLIDRASLELSLMGVSDSLPVIDRVASEISSLFK